MRGKRRAAGLDLRTVDGAALHAGRSADARPTLLVTVSVDDLDAVTRTRELRDFAHGQELQVVLVSTDAANARISVLRWARRHADDMPVVADPDGQVLPSGIGGPFTARLLAADGQTLGTWHAWDGAARAEIRDELPTRPSPPVLRPVEPVEVDEDPEIAVSLDAALTVHGGAHPGAVSLRSGGERTPGPE